MSTDYSKLVARARSRVRENAALGELVHDPAEYLEWQLADAIDGLVKERDRAYRDVQSLNTGLVDLTHNYDEQAAELAHLKEENEKLRAALIHAEINRGRAEIASKQDTSPILRQRKGEKR